MTIKTLLMKMEAEEEQVGISHLMPSVQELVKQSLLSVPPRYVQFDGDHQSPIISDSAYLSSLPQIPVIDMERLFSQEYMDIELHSFHLACQHWGFFQLINHGVSSSLMEKVKVEIQNFFNLPMEEKKKYWQKPGKVEGFGQAFVMSEEQKLDWGDMFALSTLPTHRRHLFPSLPISLREVLEAYSEETKNLAMKIFDLTARALSIPLEEIREVFEGGNQNMRMNYYPPCPEPELVLGLNAHSDAGGLTILLQVNETDGLQINKEGTWIPVTPLPNALIINIGDILQIFTNGKYRSIEHRSIVNLNKERISIASFHTGKMDGEVGPATSLINPESPARFKRISFAEYNKGFFLQALNGKSYLDVMRIQNDDAKPS